MRISRIFRKYSRVLLLVFMSLLLIVFLVGDVVGRAANQRNQEINKIGTAFGEDVYSTALSAAISDITVTSQLGIMPVRVFGDDQFKNSVAQYLLLEEARRAGVRMATADIQEMLRQSPVAVENMSAMIQRTGRDLNSICDSVGRVVAANMYFRYQLESLNDEATPRLEKQYRDANQQARVILSVIEGNGLLDAVPEPTEAELAALFEEGKDRRTQHTADELVFGYQVSDRVQVEYLTVNPKEIEAQVRVSNSEARNYFEQNPNKYFTVQQPSAFELTESTQPERVPMTFEQAREQVKEDVRAEKAIKEAQRLVNDLHRAARVPWDKAMGDQSDGASDGPAPAAAIVSFEELRKRFSQDAYLVKYAKTGLVDARTMQQERGFAQAGAPFQDRRVTSAELAFRVEGLMEKTADDPLPVLKINEPSPVMIQMQRTAAGGEQEPYQAYVFRVIQADPAGPPKSIEEVRERLVADAKRLKAFALAVEKAQEIAANAEQIGLKAAVEQADDVRTLLAGEVEGPTAETQPADPIKERYARNFESTEVNDFSRRPRPLGTVGYIPELNEKVFADLDERGAPTEGEHRVVVVSNASGTKVALAEVLELRPLYRGEFDLQRESIEQNAVRSEQQMFAFTWFSADSILARTGFVSAITNPTPEDEAADPTSTN